ncbi:MAG: amidohydrolase family protein [Saprospiraceae bacterium]|nr:amidohydrolase family protein [Candidatus Opimibacter iunctus]
MKNFLCLVLSLFPLWAFSQAGSDIAPVKSLLINNVQIFNGKDEKTITGNVLVVNNLISKISTAPIPVNRSGETIVIDGKGKFLMPGLIDAHMHMVLAGSTLSQMQNGEVGAAFIRAGEEAGNVLQRGFTSVRDLGGPSFGLKQTIDAGVIPGPRIWPSGPMISQTSGHGDFRNINQRPVSLGGCLDHSEQIDAALIADGRDAVLVAARETLKRGASQIKLCAGGGVSSVFDPIDVSQYSEDEIRAAVEAAADWGTYVTVHAFTPRAVNKAIAAGVQCIEHGQLLDEATMKLMGEKGVWLSIQALDSEGREDFTAEQKQKKADVANGADAVIKLAKKYGVKMAWGTDVFFNPAINKNQNTYIAKMGNWFTPYEVLKLITSDNARLLALSGNRSPYREGALGVIEVGAYADLLLVDGNPLSDINVMVDYDKNFVLIIKDGKVCKNTIR